MSTMHNNGGKTAWSVLPRNVKLLGLASLVNDISSEIIFPLLPRFVLTVLGGSKLQLGAIEGIGESLSSLLKLVFGGISDRTGGRKWLVAAGYTVSSVVKPLIGLSTSVWGVLACRTGDRIGKGVRTSARDALIADSTPPDNRGLAFGFHRAMDHLGASIGPVLAAVFLFFFPNELRWLFLATIVPGVVVVAIVVFGLREPAAVATGTPFRLSLRGFDRNFRIYLVTLVVFTLGNASDVFLLVRAGELGVPVWATPLLWCVFGLAKSGGNLLAGPQADRLRPRTLIAAGWAVYAGTYLLFAFASQAWHAWALFLLYAVFYSLTEPAEKKLVASLSSAENRGLAYGWFHLAIGVAALPSSLLFGWLYDYSALAAFGTGAGLALVAAMMLSLVREGSTPRR